MNCWRRRQPAILTADRLGQDGNHWQTGFGPTNVEVHRLAAALDLGDVLFVVQRAPLVETAHLPVERSVSHLVDTARALSLVARDDECVAALLRAERMAPQLVRHSAGVRETVKRVYRRRPPTAGRRPSPVTGLAERCRAIS